MWKKRIINTLLASPIPTDRQIQQDMKAFIVRPNLIACPLVLKCKVIDHLHKAGTHLPPIPRHTRETLYNNPDTQF